MGWLRDKPKDEWILVEDTHMAIIDEDVFNIANEKLKSRKRPYKTGETGIFSGLVKCPDCCKSLNLGRNNSKKQEVLLTCNTYRRYGKALCTQHRILYDDLYNIVLKDIRNNALLALKDETIIIKNLCDNKDDTKADELMAIAKEIEESSHRYKELERKIAKLYDD